MYRGEEHLSNQKDAEATAAFERAQTLFREIIQLFERAWPDHAGSGIYHFHVGNIHSLQRSYADAVASLRKALALYEAHEGVQAENTRYIVQRLAKVLRSANRDSEAADLEARYGMKAPGGG